MVWGSHRLQSLFFFTDHRKTLIYGNQRISGVTEETNLFWKLNVSHCSSLASNMLPNVFPEEVLRKFRNNHNCLDVSLFVEIPLYNHCISIIVFYHQGLLFLQKLNIKLCNGKHWIFILNSYIKQNRFDN